MAEAEAGSLASRYEEFCESLKANPPPWVRAEIDGATAEVEQLQGGDDAELPPISLDLRGNCLPERFEARLASADVFPVTEALRNDVRITSVDLGYNKIDASGAAAVGRVLSQNGTLLNINLEFNDIGADGGKSIAEALPSCTSLRQLVLRGNDMGDDAGVAVASGLNASPIELLDISSCDVGIKTIIKVAQAAESSDCKLSHLYLSNARTRVNEDQKGIVLARMIKLNTSLVCLDVSRMKLSDDDAEHIVRNLKVNTTLKSISLAANKLSWVAGTHFGKYLAENPELEELDLSGNELHDNGVYGMREALIENRRLLYLNLSACGVTDDGLLAVAEGLSANESLQTLHLWGNTFGEASASLFLSVAQHASELRTDFLPYEVDGKTLVARA